MHPFLLEGIPSYVVFLVLAFSVGYLDALRRARTEQLPTKIVERAYLSFLFGALVGARLFHVLLEDPSYYASAPNRVLAFWQGGFSIWGGFVGAISGLAAMSRFTSSPLLPILDAFAPSALLGIAIGRAGCLLAGCCFGLPTAMPWGIAFDHPSTFADFPEVPLHPTQLYEAFGCLLLSVVTRRKFATGGMRFAAALGGYGALRFVVEFFRGDVARGWLIPDVLSLPQAFALGAIVVSVVTFVRAAGPDGLGRGPIRPGVRDF